MKDKLTDWINKNYRRSTQPLYAWVDAFDLLSFIKTLDTPTPPTQEERGYLCKNPNPTHTGLTACNCPAQDTESWEEEFDKKFSTYWSRNYPEGENTIVSIKAIKDFIKQKIIPLYE